MFQLQLTEARDSPLPVATIDPRHTWLFCPVGSLPWALSLEASSYQLTQGSNIARFWGDVRPRRTHGDTEVGGGWCTWILYGVPNKNHTSRVLESIG
jgi:hypothetical protein